MADDQGEKTEEPSQHRLDESRKKGDVASSRELNSVLILAGSLTVLTFSGVYIFELFYEYISWLYSLDVKKAFAEELGKRILSKTIITAAKSVAPVMLSSFILGIISQIMQVGILFAPEVLQLKFERVDPFKGIKRIWSVRSLVEALKGVFKFSVVLGITYSVVSQGLDTFTGFLHTDAMQAISYGKLLAFKLGMSILLGLLIIAAADFAWQKFSHKQKLRMTKQELKEENKEREGNPEVRQKIRSIQREMSQKRMMEEIPKADVLIANPTHISVVIRYDGLTMVAPTVTAKGVDHLALKMREIAKEHGVPIVENVPLARALNKTVKVGEGVPRSLYKAVAEVLAFVYKLKKKKKALE